MNLTNPKRIERQLLDTPPEEVIAERNRNLTAQCKAIIAAHDHGIHNHTFTGREQSKALAEMARITLKQIQQ